MSDLRIGGACHGCGQYPGLCRCASVVLSAEQRKRDSDRETRIRALAASIAATVYELCPIGSRDGALIVDSRDDAALKSSLERAAYIIDALDSLPVPERTDR